MNSSDLVAWLALLVSIVGSGVSIWYTRRQFASANIPVLLPTWNPWIATTIKFDGTNNAIQQTKFYIRLKNGHSSVLVSDIKASIVLQSGRSRLGQRRHVAYCDYHLSALDPLREERQSFSVNPVNPVFEYLVIPVFEDFIIEKIPGILTKKHLGLMALSWRTNESGFTDPEKPSDVFYYEVNHVQPLVLLPSSP